MITTAFFVIFGLANRRLSELAPTDECVRWGALASFACPELIGGDIRAACASCSSIVKRVQAECYDSFPGELCTGNCFAAPEAFTQCGLPACTACWEQQADEACAACPAVCFTHAHCFDPVTQTFSEPDNVHRDDIVKDCDGLKRAYRNNDCCSTNDTLKNASMYIRI